MIVCDSRSESKDKILEKSGVGLIKRRILSNHVGRITIDVQVEYNVSDKHTAAPRIRLIAHYPLGVKKESQFTVDGNEFNQPVRK